MTCALFLDREKFTSLITYIVLVRGNNTNFPLLNFAVALSLNKVRRELGCQFLCVVVKPLNSHDISLPRTSASSPIKREYRPDPDWCPAQARDRPSKPSRNSQGPAGLLTIYFESNFSNFLHPESK